MPVDEVRDATIAATARMPTMMTAATRIEIHVFRVLWLIALDL